MSARERERQRAIRMSKLKYSPPPASTPDAAIVAGVSVEVSSDTSTARGRSDIGARRNTMSKGYCRDRFDPEELAGKARMTPPTVAAVKERDDWGMAYPRQHMATPSDPNETLRTRIAMRKNLFQASGEGGPEVTNYMWPGTFAFDGTRRTDTRRTPAFRDEPISMK